MVEYDDKVLQLVSILAAQSLFGDFAHGYLLQKSF